MDKCIKCKNEFIPLWPTQLICKKCQLRLVNYQDIFVKVFLGVCIVGAVVIGFMAMSMAVDAPVETSDERFNRLQQERFQYEREQQDVQDYLRRRETSNKIKSGYYD